MSCYAANYCLPGRRMTGVRLICPGAQIPVFGIPVYTHPPYMGSLCKSLEHAPSIGHLHLCVKGFQKVCGGIRQEVSCCATGQWSASDENGTPPTWRIRSRRSARWRCQRLPGETGPGDGLVAPGASAKASVVNDDVRIRHPTFGTVTGHSSASRGKQLRSAVRERSTASSADGSGSRKP